MKVYIAGPMRGLPDWNFPAFDRVEARWRGAGWTVFSPAATFRAMGYAPNDPVLASDRAHLVHVMTLDIAHIVAADALALLAGWEDSVGSTVEVAMAHFLNLGIYSAETMALLNLPTRPWSLVKAAMPKSNGIEDWSEVWRNLGGKDLRV